MSTVCGEGFRFLLDGDVIAVGDDYWDPYIKEWIKTVEHGKTVKNYPAMKYRRKENIPLRQGDPGEGWRLLEAGEEVGPGDECRSASDPDDQWTMVQRIGSQAYGLVYRAKFKSVLTKTPDHDAVNHPKHYTSHPSGVECICITEHMGFNLGNVIKYTWRADEKGNALEDLEKARFYLNREIAKRKKESQ